VRIRMIAAAVSIFFAGAMYFGQQQSITPHPKESHLRNIRQLTFGGENAEAYFSYDGKQIIFQSTRDPYKCDQMFTMNPQGSSVKLVSTGKGRTTCGYFTPDGKRIIYASTHLALQIVHHLRTGLKAMSGPSIARLTFSPRKPTEQTSGD
jgi:Tol biopolymer transport system component